jgi:nitrogen regulatory protein PII
MSEVKQDRLVRESFITRILENLYNWLPFRKQNESINFVVGTEEKEVLSIKSDGEIFYVNNLSTGNVESLQSRLSKIGLTIVNTEQELLESSVSENVSKYFYLEKSGETYCAGLYYIIINASKGGVIEPKLLGQDIKLELTNYYTKEEVENYLKEYVTHEEISNVVTEENVETIVVKKIKEIISTDENGDININLSGFVTIEEFNNRIGALEAWAGIADGESGAITVDDLEEITKIDLNNDGIVK